MSEYQYYEFAAIDRPLTRTEMAELRAVSTRAEITPSGFVNHYEWGDLKADPAEWMRRYFDAFVYTANWCSCRLALRVPLATFRKAELAPFSSRHALTIETSDTHWIIDWSLDESENYDRFGMEDGSGWMRRLAPLRDELLRGDLRPLYLGWLAGAAGGELADGALEPEVPPSLSALSPPQQALVEFLEVDPDMLAAAMAGSGCASEADSAQGDRIDAWLSEWSHDEMANMLKLIAQGRGHEAERQVRSRHAAWLKARRPSSASSASRRSVGQLRALAQSASGARLERETKERAKQETKHRQQREAALQLLMTDVDKRWAAIDAQARRGSASGYEHAVRTLVDLAEGYALTSSRKEFDRALRRFLIRHATRGALLRRLTEAGLWSG
ncbi:hypothetical protein SAMN05444679_12545 [Variovorax sp. CF079]|uniref:hypothetical protein n=1 Tax=unclassified Variovorax TaxID=663243 RepID=UPI0008903E63|nr:hypothetical protein [Variovorax sp. CF079]SDE56924.1 hypothetical protein SAMN05444679_12545 [Variovorax sp. CF079]